MNEEAVAEDLRDIADRMEDGELVVEKVSMEGPQTTDGEEGRITIEYLFEEDFRAMRRVFDAE